MEKEVTIKPKCPYCGETVTIKIGKIDRLEAKVKRLELRIRELQSTLDLFNDSKSPGYGSESDSFNFMNDILSGKKK